MQFNLKTQVLMIGLLFIGTSGLASQNHKHKHRSHSAHVHGAATLAIAFEGLSGKVQFKSATEAITGFEHAARSEADKKKLADEILNIEKNINQMVQFDMALGCVISKEAISVQQDADHGKHSDFVATFKVACVKAVQGSQLKIDFTSYTKLNDLDITVLVGDLQKTAEAKKKAVTIELK